VRDCVRRLRALAGGRGFAGRTGVAEFTVVLPGLDKDGAQALVDRWLGTPPRLEHDADGHEIVLVPDVAVDMADEDASRLEPLHARMTSRIVRLRREEQLRAAHMKRDRERHSRPMPLEIRG